jgi:O-acetyl-ADP-ribose deacetylase (regulator of RNase III)
MLTVTKGSIFDSGCEVLVNPVNCVGVMGAGLAKQFRDRYPGLEAQYRLGCKTGDVAIGRVQLVNMGPYGPVIANFPTKMDWRVPSTLAYVERGLTSLVPMLMVGGYKSVAIPALGCGLGGLEFNDVQRLIEKAFEEAKDLTVLLYPPQ